MIKKIFLGLLVAGLLWIWVVWFMPRSVDIQSDGTRFHIKSGNVEAQMRRAGPDGTLRLLLVGASDDSFLHIFKGTLCGLPAEVVDELKKKYGDFRRCGSPGASAAQSRVFDLNLIPSDKQSLATLSSIRKAVYQGKEVWVELTGIPLTVLTMSQGSIPINLDAHMKPFLVQQLHRVNAE